MFKVSNIQTTLSLKRGTTQWTFAVCLFVSSIRVKNVFLKCYSKGVCYIQNLYLHDPINEEYCFCHYLQSLQRDHSLLLW